MAQAQQQKRPPPPLPTQTSSEAVAAAHTSSPQQCKLMGPRVRLNPSAAAARLGRVNTLPAAQAQTSRCRSARAANMAMLCHAGTEGRHHVFFVRRHEPHMPLLLLPLHTTVQDLDTALLCHSPVPLKVVILVPIMPSGGCWVELRAISQSATCNLHTVNT